MTGLVQTFTHKQVVGTTRRIANNRHSLGSGNPFYPGASSEVFFITKIIQTFILVAVAMSCASRAAAETGKYNIDPFIEHLPEWVEQFKVGDRPGAYSYLPGMPRPDLYGCADMFYLMYTLDMLDLSDAERKSWKLLIGNFQEKSTGWFGGNVTLHGREHATAYAVGALKLLGTKPKYPLVFVENWDTPVEIESMLENLPWNIIWSGSHIGSGIASALVNTETVGGSWSDVYFEWLDREADPQTGYWMRRADGSRKEKATREELGGAFHFYYIYTYLGHPLPYPEKIIDTTISVQQENGLYHGDVPYCIDLDGVFSIIEAYKQTDHYRTDDVKASIGKTLAAIVERLNDPAFVDENFRGSHKLVGAVVALAEIQDFMPQLLDTPKPLRRILPISPFI